ncbi:hypothetical protein Tco_0562670, partial [Tanacetum coccineum]
IGALVMALKKLRRYICGIRCTTIRERDLYKLKLPQELDALRLDNKLYFIRELNSHESDWINSVASTLIFSQPPRLLQSSVELRGPEFS